MRKLLLIIGIFASSIIFLIAGIIIGLSVSNLNSIKKEKQIMRRPSDTLSKVPVIGNITSKELTNIENELFKSIRSPSRSAISIAREYKASNK